MLNRETLGLTRLECLKSIIEEFAKKIGIIELRAKQDHSLLGAATAEPTDESVLFFLTPLQWFFHVLALGSQLVQR